MMSPVSVLSSTTKAFLERLFQNIDFPAHAAAAVLTAAESLQSDFFQSLHDRFFAGEDIVPALKPYAEQTKTAMPLCCLTLYLLFAQTTYAAYQASGTANAVFFDSMTDFTIWEYVCEKKTGAVGLLETGWLSMTLRRKLYRLGRLQFEPSVFHAAIARCGDIIIRQGDAVLNIHIPEGSPLTRDARLDAYQKAYAFFASRFSGKPVIFTCDSWLLYPAHRLFLPQNSNILDFMDDFTLISAKEHFGSTDNLWRIFGFCDDFHAYDALPCNTALQRAYADHLRKTCCVGNGYGIFTYDGIKYCK